MASESMPGKEAKSTTCQSRTDFGNLGALATDNCASARDCNQYQMLFFLSPSLSRLFFPFFGAWLVRTLVRCYAVYADDKGLPTVPKRHECTLRGDNQTRSSIHLISTSVA